MSSRCFQRLIARDNQIGAGTVIAIINECKQNDPELNLLFKSRGNDKKRKYRSVFANILSETETKIK